MPLSPKQTAWYWREWKAVAKRLDEANLDKSEIDQARYDLHFKALGTPPKKQDHWSLKDLSSTKLDAVLVEFRVAAGTATLADGHRALEARRCSLLRAIAAHGLPVAYIAALASDTNRGTHWSQLNEQQLLNLQRTCKARAKALQAQNKHPTNAPPTPEIMTEAHRLQAAMTQLNYE